MVLWFKRSPSIFCVDHASVCVCVYFLSSQTFRVPFFSVYRAARHVQSRSVFDWTKPDYSDVLIAIKFLIENRKKNRLHSAINFANAYAYHDKLIKMHTLQNWICFETMLKKQRNTRTIQIVPRLILSPLFFVIHFSVWVISDWCISQSHGTNSTSYDFPINHTFAWRNKMRIWLCLTCRQCFDWSMSAKLSSLILLLFSSLCPPISFHSIPWVWFI